MEKFDTEAKATGQKLKRFASAANLCDILEPEEIATIGSECVKGYELDLSSIQDRLDRWERSSDLAMQVMEEKNHPFEGASNVKYPLMTTACVQFNARAYPAIVQASDIVKPKIVGQKTDDKIKQGNRASTYMSWQLRDEMDEWEEDTDRLLVMVPIYGTLFRKSWFSAVKSRPCTKLLKPENLIVNKNTQSLEMAGRITERFTMSKNEILSGIRRGVYRDIHAGQQESEDTDAPYDMLEQHTWLDLDEDGFKEPYTVTVCENNGQVLRIAPRYTEADITLNQRGLVVDIRARHFYTKYGFIPSLDGCFYDIGFADILYPINEAINTNINQLIDAGTLQNKNTGFISSTLAIGSGKVRMKMGEMMKVKATGDDIRRGIVLQQWPGPSPTLFQLLGLLIEAGKDISGVKDVLTGEGQGMNQPASTTLALIEQGMKVFSAIYKRIHRALASELRKLQDINFTYLNPQNYINVLDEPVSKEDFDPSTCDFYPVSDPTVVTDMQRMGRANYLLQFANDPFVNPLEVRKRALEAASIEDIEGLLVPPSNEPSIEQRIELAKEERAKLELMLEVRKSYREDAKTEADIEKSKSETIKNLVDADSKTVDTQLGIYQQQAEALYDHQQRGVSGMAGPSGNEGVYGVPPEGAGELQGGMGGGQLSGGIEPDPYAPNDPNSPGQVPGVGGGFEPQV